MKEFTGKIEAEFKEFIQGISQKTKDTFPSLDLQSIVDKEVINERIKILLINDGKELFNEKETSQITLT